MKALPRSVSWQEAFFLGTGRGILVTFRTENCTLCFFWVSTALAKHVEKLSVIQQPCLLGWEFPGGGVVYWGIYNSVFQSRGRCLARRGSGFPSRVSELFRAEKPILGSALSFLQWRKKWSRNDRAERLTGNHQQLASGLGHVLTRLHTIHYH